MHSELNTGDALCKIREKCRRFEAKIFESSEYFRILKEGAEILSYNCLAKDAWVKNSNIYI